MNDTVAIGVDLTIVAELIPVLITLKLPVKQDNKTTPVPVKS